jgi:hypothetical protein
MEEYKMSEIKEQLKGLVGKGWTEAKFGHLANAKIFSNLLAAKGIQSKISELLGHATTVDTDPKVILTKHFLVYGEKTSAHRVLGKFV